MVIQAFQIAALKCGFVEMDECGRGTVVWLKRAKMDAPAETHQRMCIDTVTDSATVYWTNVRDKIDSKTFRSVTTLQEWMSNSILVEQLNPVLLESSSPDCLQSLLELSIAATAGKGAS
jgi:hypothetical protein